MNKKSRIFDNIIDFDAASEAWRKNKISIGYGSFRYRCTAKTKIGELCKNKPKTGKKYCHVHSHLKT